MSETAAGSPIVKCAACDFAVTGVTDTHCCNKCKTQPGQHGARCARRPFAAAAVGAAPEPKAVVQGAGPMLKCAGCEFAVTGVTDTHCCNRCKNQPGQHGGACKRQPFVAVASMAFTPPPRPPAALAAEPADAAAGGEEEDDDSSWETPMCEEGGWADGASDGQYDSESPLPLIPRLAPPPAAKAKAAAGGRKQDPPPADEYRLWVEDVAFQVGNAAHEIRNALRFWASLVEPGAAGAEGLAQRFKKADNKSGQLEATMRQLVGRARNAPKLENPMGRLLPKGQELLEVVKGHLAALGQMSEAVAPEQRGAIRALLDRQQAYLAALVAARLAGGPPVLGNAAAGAPVPLPPPGKRVDFGAWRDEETSFVAAMQQAADAKQPLAAEQAIGLARLACNQAHELQNLASAPRGGAGTKAMKHLKELDAIGGKCENAARAAMVFAHKWHVTKNAKPAEKMANRAAFLQDAAARCEKVLEAAVAAEGGSTVPAGAYKVAIGRLAQLGKILHGANMPGVVRKDVNRAAPNLGARCAGCDYLVTGITPQHCCKRCSKHPGEHGKACLRQAAAQGPPGNGAAAVAASAA